MISNENQLVQEKKYLQLANEYNTAGKFFEAACIFNRLKMFDEAKRNALLANDIPFAMEIIAQMGESLFDSLQQWLTVELKRLGKEVDDAQILFVASKSAWDKDQLVGFWYAIPKMLGNPWDILRNMKNEMRKSDAFLKEDEDHVVLCFTGFDDVGLTEDLAQECGITEPIDFFILAELMGRLDHGLIKQVLVDWTTEWVSIRDVDYFYDDVEECVREHYSDQYPWEMDEWIDWDAFSSSLVENESIIVIEADSGTYCFWQP